MNRRAWIVLALAVVVTVPAVLQVQGRAESEGPNAPDQVPWWGPEGFDEGWTLRVPVTVENTRGYAISNAPVTVDLDVGQLAKEAGWPTGKTGTETLLKGFQLQPDSVRVTSYTNFQIPRRSPSDASLQVASPDQSAADRYTVPARATTGFLEETPPGPFDAEKNPIVSVRWVAEGAMEPGQTRNYMIYLEVTQHGAQPPADEQRVYDALGDRHWISRGQEVYGSGERATITGLHDGTEVAVYTYDGPAPQLANLDGDNPFVLGDQETRRVFLGPDPEPFRVEASKPLVASGHQGPQDNVARQWWDLGFIPSADGTLEGKEFQATVYPARYYVYATTATGAAGRLNGQEFHTEGAVTPVQVQGNTLRLSVDNPVLVQAEPGHRRHQFASLTGAPVGAQLGGTYHGFRTVNGQPVRDSGVVHISTFDDASHVVGRTNDDDPRTVIPSAGGSEGLTVTPNDTGFARGRDSWGFMPVSLEAVDASNPDQRDETARVLAFGGRASEPYSSAIGGEWAQTFVGPTDAHVFGFYNRTRVEATSGAGETHVTVLERGQRIEVQGSTSSPFELTASKPVAVIPTSHTGYGAGRVEGLTSRVGSLQYRGHLVSLSPEGGTEEPVVETTTFGEPVTYHLVVENRGRETDGGSLRDTIELSHSPVPAGWNVTLGTREVQLDSGENRTVTVEVRPPKTRSQGTRLNMEVRATSQGNPDLEVGVNLVTLLRERRGVGIWYEEVDGPQSLSLPFEPGEERRVPVLVENQGSGPDTFEITRTRGQTGWSAEILDDGEPVDALTLATGEVREATLVVEAPGRGSLAIPTSFSITAASTNDTTAAEKVLFEGLVLAESDVRLETPEELVRARPGQEIVFPLKLSNDGNASADVQLNASLSAPPGWETPEFRHRGKSLAPVGDRLSSVPPTGDDPVDLNFVVPVPDNASGRQSVKILVTATPQSSGASAVSLPLNVFVRPTVQLSVDPPTEVSAVPGRTVTWQMTVHNRGNVNATLTLAPADIPPGWRLDHPVSLSIPEGGTRGLDGKLTLPAGTAPANETVTLNLELPNGTARSASIPVTVPRWREVEIQPDEAPLVVPGVPKTLTARLHNLGNREAPTDVTVDAPDDWQVDTVAHPSTLAPVQSGTLRLNVTPPRGVGETTVNLTLSSDVDRGPSLPGIPPPASATLEVRTSVPDLVAINASSDDTGRDGPATVRGVVTNTGEAVVENVTVGLLRGDTVLAETTLSRIPSGSPRGVAIQLPADAAGTPGDLSLVVDPADLVPETDEGNNRARVTAEAAPTPAPGALAALVVAGLSALAARRRACG